MEDIHKYKMDIDGNQTKIEDRHRQRVDIDKRYRYRWE